MILLLLAALTAEPLTLCADRPSKGEAPCTVPAGHWQIESALAQRSLDRDGDDRLLDWGLGETVIKRGIGPATDFEITVPAYRIVHHRTAGGSDRVHGFGDAEVRLKHRFTAEDAKLGAGAIGFVTLPTGKGSLGAGAVEAGVIVPLELDIGSNWSLGASPEANWRADEDGHGHHGAYSGAIEITAPIGDKLQLTLEGWAERERDFGQTAHRASADIGLAFSPTKRLQFDAEADVGLTHDTPDLELAIGVSALF